jgi:hypothetical protein
MGKTRNAHRVLVGETLSNVHLKYRIEHITVTLTYGLGRWVETMDNGRVTIRPHFSGHVLIFKG